MRKIRDKITVIIDKAKAVKRLSREVVGRPGAGRKTKFVDRKKQADRMACRKRGNEE